MGKIEKPFAALSRKGKKPRKLPTMRLWIATHYAVFSSKPRARSRSFFFRTFASKAYFLDSRASLLLQWLLNPFPFHLEPLLIRRLVLFVFYSPRRSQSSFAIKRKTQPPSETHSCHFKGIFKAKIRNSFISAKLTIRVKKKKRLLFYFCSEMGLFEEKLCQKQRFLFLKSTSVGINEKEWCLKKEFLGDK